MSYVFPAPPQISIPVRGSQVRFPVRRIYCVGRNYAEHVKEMGGEVSRDPPFFFMKPADAIVVDGRFPYPAVSTDVHHEIELVVALGPNAVPFGYGAGLDMTRRDLQAAAKKLGRPAKGAISLDVNGVRRQTGDIAGMIWSVAEITAELGKLFELHAGDLIFTGTPSGVGPVQRGDRLHGAIAGIGTLDVDVV
jgi:fumarylpyruvate hydrolase